MTLHPYILIAAVLAFVLLCWTVYRLANCIDRCTDEIDSLRRDLAELQADNLANDAAAQLSVNAFTHLRKRLDAIGDAARGIPRPREGDKR